MESKRNMILSSKYELVPAFSVKHHNNVVNITAPNTSVNTLTHTGTFIPVQVLGAVLRRIVYIYIYIYIYMH